MGICPNCGSWVDEGDICMSCGGGGGRVSDDEYYGSRSYGGYGGGYRSYFDREKSNRRSLEFKKEMYENKLKEAREETDSDKRIKYYGEVMDYAKRYSEDSKRYGIEIDGMPDMDSVLSKEDVDWISRKHYDEYGRIHILSTDQTENLENLLRQSGNENRIKSNERTRKAICEENARKRRIERTMHLRESYFRRIEKANDLFLENKPRHALKEYKRAVSDYEQYFESDYLKDSRRSEMPDEKLTPEAVDNIIALYVKNHPLLSSGKVSAIINAEILEILDGEWDDRLEEADLEVQDILHQRRIERQRRNEKVQEIGADVIAGVRIAGDKLFNRFKR